MKIREATQDDAGDIVALYDELTDYLRSLGDTTDFQFNSRTYLRDGFGDKPAFKGLVAKVGDNVIGYLLYHLGYDTDLAARTLHVIDLYVRPAYRLQGVGRALMKRAAEICAVAGGKRLYWFVYSPNRPAFSFYERLGAQYLKDMESMYLPVEEETG
jgi:ribosomal protein S18 acetylase RimI-like enzyme